MATALLREASRYISDTSVLRRLLFAAATLPEDTPNFWEIVTKFAVAKGTSGPPLQPDQAKLVIDNIIFTDERVLSSDDSLQKELAYMPYGKREHVGVVLMSRKKSCVECGGKLLLRADCPSNVTLYTDSYGTLPAAHYHKYCRNHKKGCGGVQYYGYHTNGLFQLHFDDD